MKRFTRLLHSLFFFKIITAIFFGITIVLGILLIQNNSHRRSISSYSARQNKIVHDRQSKAYVFTNPVLDCTPFEKGAEAIVSQKDLENKIDSLKKMYDINLIAVYFRDLNNGPWLGVNETEFFSPASLAKTPYFISFLHSVEENPAITTKKVIVTTDDVSSVAQQNIKPSLTFDAGKEYTLGTIAEHTIKYSDNAGLSVLIKNTPSRYVNDLYTVLGELYNPIESGAWIRVKDAAALFRILYNASYLERDMSEYALKVFSETEYDKGLVAGVPNGIKVAHKFGERTDPINKNGTIDNTDQLHDCGIVYYPGRPYILCIMTRGHDFEKQQKVIASISKYFYQKIDAL